MEHQANKRAIKPHSTKPFEKLPIQTKSRYKIIRKLAGDVRNKVIVDIGAGAMPISKHLQTQKTITVDAVPDYKPDVICDFSQGITIEDETADIILAGEIIEHLFDPYTFLQECNRILKNKGRLILTTPNICSLKNRIKVLFGQMPESCAEPLEDTSYERHVVDFTLARLVDMAQARGFVLQKATTNGIITRSKRIWPLALTPTTWGETLIVVLQKK